MEKIKKLLFLSAIIIAFVMSSCSSDKHKAYIPADSKVLGKIDVKAFFDQTGVDKDKLINDIKDNLCKSDEAEEEFEALQEMGIDIDVPIYLFARSKGANFSFGVVAKVDDKEKVRNYFDEKEDKTGIKIKEGDGFDYGVRNNSAIGLNNDALVFLVVTGSDVEAKKQIKDIMNKNIDGDINDNDLMTRVKDANSFACLYADMSIITEDAVEMLGTISPNMEKKLKDLRKMVIGIDGTFSDGICDFEQWAESEDSDVQRHIDNVMSVLKAPGKKGIESVPEDALGGIVSNINGGKADGYIKDLLGIAISVGLMSSDFKDLYALFSGIVEDIDGEFVGYLFESKDYMFAVESKDDTAERLTNVIQTIEEQSEPEPYILDDNYGYEETPDYSEYSTLSYAPAQYDTEFDDDSGYGSGYGSNSSIIQEAGDGYCYDDDCWFGNRNGALYFTNRENMVSSAFEKADKQVSDALISFVQDRRFVCFINSSGLKKLLKKEGKEAKDAINAFDEILSKVDYITFSLQ